MRASTLILGPLDAADADGIAESQTPSGAGDLTLNGALVSDGVATLDVARRVAIASAGDDSGRTFTVHGTDRYGNSQQEDVTGANADTAVTVHDYATVTRIAVDAGTASTVTAGTNGEASTAWLPLDTYREPFEAVVAAILSSDGNLTFDVEHTYYNVMRDGDPDDAGEVFTKSADNTESVEATYEAPVAAVRLTTSAYTAGRVTARVHQSGVPGG